MSIAPLNTNAQTGLVPNSLLGYSNDGVSAIQITPTAITLAGNLNTTPIYVGISASTGLTTNRPNGLDIECSFDMNNNNIKNLGQEIFNTNINIQDSNNQATITSNNGNLTLGSYTNVLLGNTLNMNSKNITNVGTITATTFTGALSGNATTATTANNIATTSSNVNQNYYLPFVSSYATSTGQTLYTDQNYNITFNPSTGQLITNANISFPYGINIQDNIQYSYITSDNLGNMTIRSEDNSGQYGSINFLTEGFNLQSAYGSSDTIIFDTRGYNSIGQPGLKITNGTYNNVLTSTNISCNTFTGSLSGTATTAKNIATTAINTNATYYLPFVSASGLIPSQPLYTDLNYHITYNPSTGVLTSTTFTGSLSGNATTATTATNANNVAISDNNTSSTFYPVFASTNTGNLPLYVDKTTSPLSYVPFTGNLTATTFTGSLSGNATTATTASQVVITSESGNTNFDICMTSGTSGNLAIGDTSTLYFNPSTLTLTNSGGIISATIFNGTTFNGSLANASTVASNSSGGLTINGGSAQALIINSNASSQPINLQQNGTTQSSITSTGVQQTLLTTQGTATYSSSTLTFVSTASAPYPTYYNNIITFSGSTTAQSVSTITPPTNMPVGSCYTCYITNSNTSAGAITFNPSSLGTGIKTTYTGGVTIPINGFGLATLTKVGSSTYIFSINLVA